MRSPVCHLRQVLPLTILLPVLYVPCAYGHGTLDQANNPPWTGGATNIVPVNQVGQSFVPTLPCLLAVDVNLRTGNPGRGGDTLTLTILGSSGGSLASASQFVAEGFDGFLHFDLLTEVAVTPGQPVTIQLMGTGANVFHWKYDGGNTYPSGQAFFGGSPFSDNDFFFQTYGSTACGSHQLPDLSITSVRPVQVVFDADINGDGETDLVLNKSTAVLMTVHVANADTLHTSANVDLQFEGVTYTRGFQPSDLDSSGNAQLTFTLIPTQAGLHQQMVATVDPANLVSESNESDNTLSVTATVKVVKHFQLAYVPLANTLGDAAFLQDVAQTRQKSDEFLLATYPLANSQFSSSLTGSVIVSPSGTTCITLDCPPTVAQLAALLLNMTTTLNDFFNLRLVGFFHGADRTVGIGPKDYFARHGLCGFTGLTNKSFVFGASLVTEGFWTAVAHEIGHTYGLPLVGSEEYSSCPVKTNGNIASAGYWVTKSKPIDPLANGCDPANGVDLNCIRCFMGTTPEAVGGLDPRDTRWVELSDFEHLFRQLRINANDPAIVLIMGTISQQNEMTLRHWAFASSGTPDESQSSDLVLTMFDANGNGLATIGVPISFTWFLEGFGSVDTPSTIFAQQVPLLPGAVRFRFSRGGAVLLTQNLVTKLLRDAVDLVPDAGFIAPASQRRMALKDMIAAMDLMMSAQNFVGARQMLSTSFTNAVDNWVLDDYPLNDATDISKRQVLTLIGAMVNQLGSS